MILKVNEVKKARINKIAICECDYCKKIFERKAYFAKRVKHQFCNRKCFAKGIGGKNHYLYNNDSRKMPKGSNHWSWKGGRKITDFGYVLIYNPTHPNATRNYIREHRLVMEKKLGRYLKSTEYIHHKNGIKNDNRLENLQLIDSGKHSKKYFELMEENNKLKKEIIELKKQLKIIS